MRIKEYVINRWTILAISFICLWFVTSRQEDKAVEHRWKSYISGIYDKYPQYKELLNTYKQKPSPPFIVNGTYSYKNRYLQLTVDFEDSGKITIEKDTLHAGKNKVRASYKIVGSTMVFFDVRPSSSTWLRPGYYREAVNALVTEVQPFEIINDHEIDWLGPNGGRWKLIKQ